MKTSQPVNISSLWKMNIPLQDLGVLGMERDFSCHAVPEKSLMSFSLLNLSLSSLAADGRKPGMFKPPTAGIQP